VGQPDAVNREFKKISVFKGVEIFYKLFNMKMLTQRTLHYAVITKRKGRLTEFIAIDLDHILNYVCRYDYIDPASINDKGGNLLFQPII